MRERLRTARGERPPAERERLADTLGRVLLELDVVRHAACVAVYADLPTEPGTGPLRRLLLERGVDVLLPVTLRDKSLDWARDTGELRPSAHGGGPEPVGERLGPTGIALAGVVLVPALAVDTLGHRLGMGGGSYDRALALADPDVPVLAVVHDDEVLDAAVQAVPDEPHDRLVDGVVTPSRWMWLTSPGGPAF